MLSSPCLEDEELWPSVSGAQAAPHIEHHLQICPRCQENLRRLKREVQFIRQIALTGKFSNQHHNIQLSETDQLRPCSPKNSLASSSSNTSIKTQTSISRLKRVGRYLLEQHLSEGGQGTVYRGWDPALKRSVAIKISHRRQPPQETGRPRILREGMTLARIDHPHLVRVFDTGLHKGYPYLVMELIEGVTLQKYSETQQPSFQQIQSMILQIGSALHEVHRHGVLHLDLKPDNVMLDSKETCKLIDFGMSWNFPQSGSDEQRSVLGTIQYMAPEQCLGQTERWNCSTDVFGLGGILLYLLTQQAPFADRPSLLASQEDLHQELKQSHHRLRQHQQHASLKRICSKALSIEPNQRYPNVAVFCKAISAAQPDLQQRAVNSMGRCHENSGQADRLTHSRSDNRTMQLLKMSHWWRGPSWHSAEHFKFPAHTWYQSKLRAVYQKSHLLLIMTLGLLGTCGAEDHFATPQSPSAHIGSPLSDRESENPKHTPQFINSPFIKATGPLASSQDLMIESDDAYSKEK